MWKLGPSVSGRVVGPDCTGPSWGGVSNAVVLGKGETSCLPVTAKSNEINGAITFFKLSLFSGLTPGEDGLDEDAQIACVN